MSANNNIDWTSVIKKEARGINDADLGEVQENTTRPSDYEGRCR